MSSSNSSVRIIKWVTENNRPVNIVKDHELHELLTAGRPEIMLPSPDTISHDIKASFNKCQERITTLPCDHPGWVHFSTDAWTLKITGLLSLGLFIWNMKGQCSHFSQYHQGA